jgi:hypothetical protein
MALMTTDQAGELPQPGADSHIFYCYYFGQKMLLTLDLTWMLELLTSRFGASISIHFMDMNDAQKAASSHRLTGPVKMLAVDQRFHLYQLKPDHTLTRLPELEDEIIQWGRK